MTPLRSSPGYELTFTLLNPQPDVINAAWDIEQAIESKCLIDPFVVETMMNYQCALVSCSQPMK